MRVVFLGTPQAAVPTLEALIRSAHDVRLVVTRPDRAVGRSRRLVPPAIKVTAAAAGIEVIQPTRVRGEAFHADLARHAPGALVVVAYGRILTSAVLDLPTVAPVNLHFSLLPAYRGAAPVQWALARGEATTGVTTMRMNEGLDEGDLLLTREVAIEPGEHAPALESRLAKIGAGLLLETLDRLAAGTVEPRPQDPLAATRAPILTKQTGHVSPDIPAREIEGAVRGFDPWPGVWLKHRDRRMRLVEVKAVEAKAVEARAVEGAAADLEPGLVSAGDDGGLVLACGGGTALALLRVQPEGRRAITAREARNGRQLAPGDRLEPI